MKERNRTIKWLSKELKVSLKKKSLLSHFCRRHTVAIKIGGVLLNTGSSQSIIIAMIVTVIYCGLGDISSVLITDFILFSFAMLGAISATVIACRMPQVGRLSGLFSNPAVADKLSMIPVIKTENGFRFLETFVPVMLMPIAVQ